MRTALLVACLCLSAATVRGEEEKPLPPLTNETVLDAPVADVWAVFTTSKGWKALGVAKAEIDLRVGGKIRTHYDADGTLGDEKTIENTILAYEPHRMLAIRATRTPANFPFPAEVVEKTWSVIRLEGLGEKRTRVTIRGYGYDRSPASMRMRAFFAQGNAWTFATLRRRFAREGSAGAPVARTAVCAAEPSVVLEVVATEEGRTSIGLDGFELVARLPGRTAVLRSARGTDDAGTAFPVVFVEVELEAPGFTRVRVTAIGLEDATVRTATGRVWVAALRGLVKRFAAD